MAAANMLGTMKTPTDAEFLRIRAAAAGKYRPEQVRLLLVAEAPPCTQERYFYFEDVQTHDWLFRYVCIGLFGETPRRDNKAEFLERLREAGVFLIDLSVAPLADGAPPATLRACVGGIVERCRGLEPGTIILIKSSVYDLCYEVLKAAGLPVVDERMPFPASGQQRKFLEGFGRGVEKASGIGH